MYTEMRALGDSYEQLVCWIRDTSEEELETFQSQRFVDCSWRGLQGAVVISCCREAK